MLRILIMVIMVEKERVYSILPMFIVLALFFISIAEPAAADQESDDAKILHQFGEEIVKNNPSLASASNLEKAKAGFVEYLKKLSASNSGVSNDVWGRINDKLFADERTAFTCSVHTLNLQDIFKGMGIDSQSIGQIGGEMETYNPLNVNSDHGAVLIRDNDGKEYVFDAWVHATMRDTYSPFDDLYGEGETSPFNGMPKNEWTDQMRDEGYTTFFEDGFLADPTPSKAEKSELNPRSSYGSLSDPPELKGQIGGQPGVKTSGDNSQSSLGDLFPSEPFNGLQLSYSVSGAALNRPEDSEGFTQRRSIKGTIEGNELTVSGLAMAKNGWGATIDVRVSVDGQEDKTFHEEKFPAQGLLDDAMSQPFTVTVPIPADAKSASFTIDLTGSFNAGSRGVVVEGNLDRSSAPTGGKSIETEEVDVLEEGNSDRSSTTTGGKSIEPERSQTSEQSSSQISILPVDYAMASDVDEESSDVITRTNSFSTTDARVYCWLRFENVKEGHAIEWRWYSPDGSLFHIENRDIPTPKDMYTWYNIYSYLNIEGYHPENMPGDWQVDAFIDGEYIVTQHFTIGGQATIGWL